MLAICYPCTNSLFKLSALFSQIILAKFLFLVLIINGINCKPGVCVSYLPHHAFAFQCHQSVSWPTKSFKIWWKQRGMVQKAAGMCLHTLISLSYIILIELVSLPQRPRNMSRSAWSFLFCASRKRTFSMYDARRSFRSLNSLFSRSRLSRIVEAVWPNGESPWPSRVDDDEYSCWKIAEMVERNFLEIMD